MGKLSKHSLLSLSNNLLSSQNSISPVSYLRSHPLHDQNICTYGALSPLRSGKFPWSFQLDL